MQNTPIYNDVYMVNVSCTPSPPPSSYKYRLAPHLSSNSIISHHFLLNTLFDLEWKQAGRHGGGYCTKDDAVVRFRRRTAAPSRGGVPGQPLLPSGARVLPLHLSPGRGYRQGQHGEGHRPEPWQWRRRHPHALP
jgi:hypothetical protein